VQVQLKEGSIMWYICKWIWWMANSC